MENAIKKYRQRVEVACICVTFGVMQCGILYAHQWLMLETDWYVNWRHDEWWKWILLAATGGASYFIGMFATKLLLLGLPDPAAEL